MADTWILLRGLIREKRHWEGFPEALKQQHPGKRIICMDVAGNGERCKETSALSIRGLMESVRSRLHQKGIFGPYNLIAISMGAMISLEWLVEYPKEIERAVLMNTSLRAFNPFYDRLQPHNYRTIVKTMVTLNQYQRERRILAITSNLRNDHDSIAQRWAQYAKERPTSRTNALRQLTAAARYKAPRHAPHNRILILNGAKDRLVHPSCSINLAHNWQLPFKQHPQAGHDLALDDCHWVVKHLSDFFNQD